MLCISRHRPLLTFIPLARDSSPQLKTAAGRIHRNVSFPRNNWRLSERRFSGRMSPTRSNASAGIGERKAPSVPRPSASLILLNERYEVLMIQRNMEGSFGGATAFPGGNFDASQDNSNEMTAIRETFEETGILLASQRDTVKKKLNDVDFEEARKSIHSGKLRFVDFLQRNGFNPDTASLLPFSTWITPPMMAKRFRAQFFVAFLPSAPRVSGSTSGSHQFHLPTPDKPDKPGQTSTEIVSTSFMHPKDTLAAFARRELGLMPPQFYLLSILNDVLTAGGNSGSVGHRDDSYRAQLERLSKGSFGRMTFNPMPLELKCADGRQILTYEGDEERGGKKGTMHRSMLESQKGTPVPLGIQILRNFDIFTGFDDIVSNAKAKL